MTGAEQQRFEIRGSLREDPRFLRYEAFDRMLECLVMLECPGPALQGEVATAEGDRFLREAKMLARITHPKVVRLREVAQFDDMPALVLDLPAGESLADCFAREQTLAPDRVVQLGRDLAQAVQAAHSEGIVHRGIAAENVFLDPGTGGATLAGFTFAKLLEARARQTSLMHGQRDASGGAAAAGLPSYAAPEQLSGRGADHRADVFALGCLLYRAAVGKEAFEFEEPPLADKVVAGIPRALSNVIARCMEPTPSRRYQNMLQVEEALAALQKSGEPSRRNWILGVSVGASVVLAAFVLPEVVRAINAPELQRGRALDPAPERRESPAYNEGFEASYALVVGTNYEDNGNQPDLRTAESDARAVAKGLEDLGWTVTQLLGREASRGKILEELDELCCKGGNDRVLVYFAGHGELHPAGPDGVFYALPDDAGPSESQEGNTREHWIGGAELITPVGTAAPKHFLLVLDCCHAAAVTRSPSGGRERAPLNYPEWYQTTAQARWVLTSALAREKAVDGDEFSPFATGFLESLAEAKAGRPQDVFTVMKHVKESLAADQAPQVAWVQACSDSKAEFLLSIQQAEGRTAR